MADDDPLADLAGPGGDSVAAHATTDLADLLVRARASMAGSPHAHLVDFVGPPASDNDAAGRLLGLVRALELTAPAAGMAAQHLTKPPCLN